MFFPVSLRFQRKSIFRPTLVGQRLISCEQDPCKSDKAMIVNLVKKSKECIKFTVIKYVHDISHEKQMYRSFFFERLYLSMRELLLCFPCLKFDALSRMHSLQKMKSKQFHDPPQTWPFESRHKSHKWRANKSDGKPSFQLKPTQTLTFEVYGFYA